MSQLCFVDIETTGLNPDQHQIWEVATIIGDKEEVIQLPVDLGRADPAALEVNQFHDRRHFYFGGTAGGAKVSGLATFGEHFAKLTRGKSLVGANVGFDAEWLARLLRRNGACPQWHHRLVDIYPLVAGWLARAAEMRQLGSIESHVGARFPDGYDQMKEVATPPWDSTQLSDAVGVYRRPEDKHSALGDARWARDVYEAVMKWS